MLGADEYGFGTALLVALGCIYARQCHKNTCPVGIATQDETLRKKFKGTDEQAISYLTFVARDVRRRLAALGARSLDDISGRSDLIRRREFDHDWFANVELNALLRLPERAAAIKKPVLQATHLDNLVPRPWSVARKDPAALPPLRISPADRSVGARLSYEIAHRRATGLPVEPLSVKYRGSAGQSFGAFLTYGMTLDLAGEANDYVGKGMEGGRIIVRGFTDPTEPVAGNACFYGARGGEGFIHGGAGERFGVRNSGAELVVEGAGEHACEYMTAGMAVILGPVGKNFASGMSGGVVFITLDDAFDAGTKLSLGPTVCRVFPARPTDPDVVKMRALLERYAAATASARAAELLADWPRALERFAKVSLYVEEPAVTSEASRPLVPGR
jgi:glutamate synthase domain-containing protein 3